MTQTKEIYQLQTLKQTILSFWLLWYHYFYIFLGIFSLHTRTFFLKSYFTKTQEEGATCCWRNWRTKGTKWSHRRRTIFCVLTSVRPIVGDIHTGLYEMKSRKFPFFKQILKGKSIFWWISMYFYFGKFEPYMISVGTDLLGPIDGILKNKLNYEFQI